MQVRSPGEMLYTYDANQIQRELIAQLEAKNRYCLQLCKYAQTAQYNPTSVIK